MNCDINPHSHPLHDELERQKACMQVLLKAINELREREGMDSIELEQQLTDGTDNG